MNSRQIIEIFANLRSKGELCNYKITTCDDVVFNVHKPYIAWTSGYFKAMFTSCMVESTSDCVTLHNITSDGLAPVLDYMYGTDSVGLTASNVSQVLNAATMLQIEDVADKCAQYFITIADETNCFDIRKKTGVPRFPTFLRVFIANAPASSNLPVSSNIKP